MDILYEKFYSDLRLRNSDLQSWLGTCLKCMMQLENTSRTKWWKIFSEFAQMDTAALDIVP